MQQIYIEVSDKELARVGGAYELIGKGGPIELTVVVDRRGTRGEPGHAENVIRLQGTIVGGNPNPLAGQTHEAG